MPLSGDFKELGQLGLNIERLARVPAQAARLAAPAIKWELELEFSRGRDPYGRPWAPLRPTTLARGRKPPPLTDTGKMRGGIEVKPMRGAGIAIAFDDEIPAIFHQRGTRKMAMRPILPTNTFPAKWNDALERATLATADNVLRGK